MHFYSLVAENINLDNTSKIFQTPLKGKRCSTNAFETACYHYAV